MFFSCIELHNFGIYKGTHTISLQNQVDKRNVTLVGGMNGRGKTTILDAVFLALYGAKSAFYITGKKIAYSTFLEDRINKSAKNGRAYIRLIICVEDSDNTKITVHRSWSQNSKSGKDNLVVSKNNMEDTYLSENWEYYVEELIPFGISKFFFFDNEKISQIADDEAFNKVKDSIKSVLGVSAIETLKGHMERILREKNSALKQFETSEISQALVNADRELESIDREYEELLSQRSTVTPRIERIKLELEAKEEKFWSSGGNLGFRRDEIEKEKAQLKEQEAQRKASVLELASNAAAPLGLCQSLVNAVYDESKAQEMERAQRYSVPIISQIHHGLLQRVEELFSGMEFYETLVQLIEREFDINENGETIHTTDPLSPSSMLLIETLISEGFEEIRSLARQLHEQGTFTENSLLQLDVHLSTNAERTEAMDLMNEIRELEAEKAVLKAEIDKYDEAIDALQKRKDEVSLKRFKLQRRLAEIADQNDDNVRVVQYANMTIDIMSAFAESLQHKKVQTLKDNIISCFHYLAQKESIVTDILIDEKTLDITLKDYTGGILLKSQLSAGEKQMFAISILWGLALTSGYKLPMIIDTPMGRLDSAHRSNFVTKYLPKASSQVIVLSTDEEVYGQYLDELQQYINQYYTIIYDEEEKCSSIVSGYFGGIGS